MDKPQTQEVGFVRSVRDFLGLIEGFPTASINDLVENEDGVRGLISSLLPNEVEVLFLDDGNIQPGQLFKKSNTGLRIPVGSFLLGRAVNPLGVAIDGKGALNKTTSDSLSELEKVAPGIEARELINQQLDTGVAIIDTLIPIGKGQRELVVGDARSGKTDFLLDVLINQQHTGTVCIYASIGKSISEVRNLLDTLQANKTFAYTCVVAAVSSDPAPLIFLTPQTAFSIAEYFQAQGKDVLLILDDLGNHAKIYREISLLGNKSPGRESYPGDIFYQHSRLLERAGNFKKEAGGGSITAIPVIEINLNDFTTLVPTNLMATTDGHLMFKSSLYNQGQRPAIDISLSVSRVGQQTQPQIMNLLATRLKQILAQADQLETISRFSFELPLATQITLRQKDMIEQLVRQQSLSYTPKQAQILLLTLPLTQLAGKIKKEISQKKQQDLIQAILTDPKLIELSKAALTIKDLNELITKLEQNMTNLEAIALS